MKKIKKSHIALSLASLALVGAVGISSAMASTATPTTNTTTTVTSASTTPKNITKAQRQIHKEANMKVMQDRKAAVEAALKAKDYNAWVVAVGPNAPILKKINASNFNRFVEAYNLQQQADSIMTELGVDKGEGRGMWNVGHMNGHNFEKFEVEK